MLAYLRKPMVSRPRSDSFLIMDEPAGGEGAGRSLRGALRSQAFLTVALLLTVVLAGLTTAVLR